MIHFNRSERQFLLYLCGILFLGTCAQWSLKKYPGLLNQVNVLESPRFYPKINVNTASAGTLVRIPYIGEYTAGKIVAYRQKVGKYSSLEELKNVEGIKARNYERFAPYLKLK